MYVADLQYPVVPEYLGYFESPVFRADCADKVLMHGDSAYVAYSGSGMLVLDMSHPQWPLLAGCYRCDGSHLVMDLAFDWPYVYMAGINGLAVAEILPEGAISELAEDLSGRQAYKVSTANGYAYSMGPNEFTVMRLSLNPGKVDHPHGAPVAEYSLTQNYPNPFNARTVITYQLPQAGAMRLAVYNTLGQEVVRLSDGVQAAGSHRVEWNAEELPSGVYVAQLTAGGKRHAMKMLLVK